MDKSSYQALRFAVECDVSQSISDPVAVRELTNLIMAKFVSALADSQIKQGHAKRAFLTFRRNSNVIPPSWAFRKPGIDSRLPTL